MLVIVSYDVSTEQAAGRRRLRRVAKTCQNFGQRVQNSVFECLVDSEQWTRLRARLLEEFEPEEDSLLFYFLGKSWRGRREHHGAKPTLDLEEPLVL
jgi:CRISPR-associated protein Cas2